MGRIAKTLVLVHGAWHGSWCWQRVVPLVESRGIAVRAVDLPSTSAHTTVENNLSGDAAAVGKVIDDIAGEVVLCGHSYGGMVISHELAGGHPRVAHLAYLCAFVPSRGESLFGIGGGKPAPWIRTDERRMTLPDLSRAAEVFYADCESDTQQWAIGQLRLQPSAPFEEAVPVPAWEKVPSTYIVCVQDRALPEDLQRNVFATRTRATRELNASHSPFLSQPTQLAELLAAIVEA
jgi:pimeloyl-ACP methyl ester carboxylesterase